MPMRWAVDPGEIPKPRRELDLRTVMGARILPAERRNAQPSRYTKNQRRNTTDYRY